MAESVLSSLVKTDKETKDHLEQINGTLNKIYKLQVATAKEESAHRKRLEQKAKRKSGDRLGAVMGTTKDKKDKDKKKGGLLDMLGNLTSIGTFLGSLLGPLKVLSKLLVGGLLIDGLRKLINLFKNIPFLEKGFKLFKDFFTKGLDKLKNLFNINSLAKAVKGFFVGPKSIFSKLGDLVSKINPKSLIKGGGIISGLTSGITEFFETGSYTDALFAGGGAAAGAIGGGILGSFLGPLGTVVGSALGGFIGDQLGGIIKDQLDKVPWLGEFFGEIDKTFNKFLTALGKIGGAIGRIAGNITDFIKGTWTFFTDGVKSIAGFFEDRFKPIFEGVVNFFDDNVTPVLKEISKFLSPIVEPIKELALKVLDPLIKHFKFLGESIGNLVKFIGKIVNPVNLVKGIGDIWENIGNWADTVGRQTGGPVTVPGSGSGDKVPMLLPSGSFVMNREASRFQNGGMVPTLLEPGENVYGPGQWGAQHVMLNSAIPRFQTGGMASFKEDAFSNRKLQEKGNSNFIKTLKTADHPDTGPGWSIGPDSQGRPSVFTQGAAEALMKAIKESNGLVKTSDITSSKRSPAKNASVGGVPNSNHLTGNAVDIHGTSKVWLKENGMKYGWKNLVYGGHDGHFDFTGKGGSPIPGDGKERTADNDSKEGGGNSNILSSTLKGIGIAGEYIKATLDVFQEVFGSEISGLLGGMFGGSGSGGDKDSGSEVSGGTNTGGIDLSSITGGGDYGKDSLIKALDSANITNKKERAMFLSQMHHESGGFKYREEIHDGSNYEGRSDLGNTQPGDGKRYKGRGYIQLTGRSNYRQYGNLVGADLEKNPELAAEPGIAAKVALAYWNQRVDRDAARRGDVLTVTRNINGGTNGLADRENLYSEYSKKGYQTGGSVHMQSTASSSAMARQSENNFIDRMAQSMSPVVVPMPMGGGGQTSVASAGSPTPPVPTLPANPNNTAALDLAFRLSMGASFA